MERVKIGWATRDVTTPEPVGIPGQFHLRISEGVLDPLTVTALVVDGGDDTAIFLSADLVVIRSCLLDLVREKVARLNPEIPVLKILMNATHSHTGGDHYKSGTDDFPCDLPRYSGDNYREHLATGCAEAVAEAWAKRASGGVAWGYGHAVVSYSRRVVYFDDVSQRPGATKDSAAGVNGHARMYGNTNDPMFSHYEAGADHFVNLLWQADRGDRQRAVPVAELGARAAPIGLLLARGARGHPRAARRHLHPAAVRRGGRPLAAHPALPEGGGAALRAQVRR